MNEAIRNVAMLVWAVCAINSDAEAQSSRLFISEENSAPQQETMVYGAAKKSSGGEDEFLLGAAGRLRQSFGKSDNFRQRR